jgi:hypothetical protein
MTNNSVQLYHEQIRKNNEEERRRVQSQAEKREKQFQNTHQYIQTLLPELVQQVKNGNTRFVVKYHHDIGSDCDYVGYNTFRDELRTIIQDLGIYVTNIDLHIKIDIIGITHGVGVVYTIMITFLQFIRIQFILIFKKVI